MAVKMTQQEWGTQKGWSPGYIPSKEEMAEKLSVLYTADQLTKEEYVELMAMLEAQIGGFI